MWINFIISFRLSFTLYGVLLLLYECIFSSISIFVFSTHVLFKNVFNFFLFYYPLVQEKLVNITSFIITTIYSRDNIFG